MKRFKSNVYKIIPHIASSVSPKKTKDAVFAAREKAVIKACLLKRNAMQTRHSTNGLMENACLHAEKLQAKLATGRKEDARIAVILMRIN